MEPFDVVWQLLVIWSLTRVVFFVTVVPLGILSGSKILMNCTTGWSPGTSEHMSWFIWTPGGARVDAWFNVCFCGECWLKNKTKKLDVCWFLFKKSYGAVVCTVSCFSFVGGCSFTVSTMILLFVGDELLKEVVSFVFGTSSESLKM